MVALADTSAWANQGKDEPVRVAFAGRVTSGEIATCDMVRLELLFTSRDHEDFAVMREKLDSLRTAPIGDRAWRRATDVFELFAERGPLHHRQIGIADLLIAAAAELAELTLLHYDRHFELIAEVTGQPVEAIAPLGSLD